MNFIKEANKPKRGIERDMRDLNRSRLIHKPDLACRRVCKDYKLENSFCIFKWLQQKSKERNFITYGNEVPVSSEGVLLDTGPPSFFSVGSAFTLQE